MNNKKNHIILALLFCSVLLKCITINYGIPFYFHPDEVGILKDPLRLLMRYMHFDFSASTSLYNWFALLWDAVIFLVGRFLGKWHSISEFQTAFIAESMFIFFMARCLSAILTIAAQYVLLRLAKLSIEKNIFFIAFGLIIIFNPIELLSTVWVKFDALCYLFHAVLLLHFYKFFILKEEMKKVRLYLLCFLALSLRIEFVTYLLCFVVYELISGQYDVKEKIQRMVYPVGIGILLYSVITLVPVSLFYNKYLSVGSANGLATQKPYAEVIFSGFSGLLKFNMGAILENFFHNIYFYLFHYLFIGVGPVLFITAAIFMLKDKRSKIFIWLTICLLMPVLLYIVSTPHYVLGVSVFMIFFGSLGLYVSPLNNIQKIIISFINVLYIATISLQIIYKMYDTAEEPRLVARNYLLANSLQKDTIAIEAYLNPGLYPPIEECSEVMIAKAGIIRNYHIGTGETLMQKAKEKNPNCRNVLEVNTDDRFFKTPYKGILLNTFDTVTFPAKNILFYSTMTDYTVKRENMDYFVRFLNRHFVLQKSFESYFSDRRLYSILPTEGFFFPVYIYKNKNKINVISENHLQ